MKTDWDYEIPFWKKWLEADTFKRLELVKKLPIIKELLMDVTKRNKKLWNYSFATLLNSYFEDLESAVYTKIRLEKRK